MKDSPAGELCSAGEEVGVVRYQRLLALSLAAQPFNQPLEQQRQFAGH